MVIFAVCLWPVHDVTQAMEPDEEVKCYTKKDLCKKIKEIYVWWGVKIGFYQFCENIAQAKKINMELLGLNPLTILYVCEDKLKKALSDIGKSKKSFCDPEVIDSLSLAQLHTYYHILFRYYFVSRGLIVLEKTNTEYEIYLHGLHDPDWYKWYKLDLKKKAKEAKKEALEEMEKKEKEKNGEGDRIKSGNIFSQSKVCIEKKYFIEDHFKEIQNGIQTEKGESPHFFDSESEDEDELKLTNNDVKGKDLALSEDESEESEDGNEEKDPEG